MMVDKLFEVFDQYLIFTPNANNQRVKRFINEILCCGALGAFGIRYEWSKCLGFILENYLYIASHSLRTYGRFAFYPFVVDTEKAIRAETLLEFSKENFDFPCCDIAKAKTSQRGFSKKILAPRNFICNSPKSPDIICLNSRHVAGSYWRLAIGTARLLSLEKAEEALDHVRIVLAREDISPIQRNAWKNISSENTLFYSTSDPVVLGGASGSPIFILSQDGKYKLIAIHVGVLTEKCSKDENYIGVGHYLSVN